MTRTAKSKQLDRNGMQLEVGDVVRVVGIPDLTGMTADGIKESLPVFEYLVGRYKRIHAFDDWGLAQLSFAIPRGPQRGWHGVFIETSLLHKRQNRLNKAFMRGPARKQPAA